MSRHVGRVVLTGASGFIGRWACAALRARGYEVHAIGRAPSVAKTDGVVWHAADILDRASVGSVVRDVRAERLLHVAWVTEHGEYWSSPKNLDWVEATKELFARFVEAGGGRVVFAGTCAEYDWNDPSLAHGTCHESSPSGTPRTLYGASKLTIAKWLEERGTWSWASGRVFFAYGENENPRRLIPSVICALLQGERARMGPGDLVRDFMHVADVGAAFAALLVSDAQGAVNVASGTGTTLASVAETIARIVRKPDAIDVGALEGRPMDPPRLVASVERLRAECRFSPSIDLELGLRRTVDWWRAEADLQARASSQEPGRMRGPGRV